jgi:hypothetical protein
MTTATRTSSPLLGKLGAAFGAAALAATAWLALLTFTSFGPPDVVRFLGAVFLPIGIGGAIGVAIAERRGPGRRLALAGLGLAALAVVVLVVMQLAVGY